MYTNTAILKKYKKPIKNIKYNLTRNGAIINKNDISFELLDKIKKELTVKPKILEEYGAENLSFEVYTETEDTINIPRHYARELLGKPDKRFGLTGIPITLHFTGDLRQYQKDVIKSTIESLQKKGGGIISLPCGFGKTVISLALAAELGLKTLVIVHKTFLLNQWYERIKQFTDARIGTIKQKKNRC